MKRIILIIALLIFGFKGFSQVDSTQQKKEIRLRCCRIQDSTKQALIILNGNAFNMKYMNGINPNVIKDVNVFKGVDAIKKYGNKAEYGAIVISIKNDAKWRDVETILKKNKINNHEPKLPIIYNGYLLEAHAIISDKETKYKVTNLDAVNYQLRDRIINGKYLLISETK